MGERGWSRGHPGESVLKDFADGVLDEGPTVAVESHLMFGCPDGRCCRVLHRFPNAIDAVLRAAARNRRIRRGVVSVYRLTKSFTFEASHQLPRHDGKCRRLHGHSWKCSLVVEGDRLIEGGPKSGMLADYADLGKVTRSLHDQLDHRHLNDLIDNPTSERLAAWVYEQARPQVEASGVRLAAVVVEETCTARCEYLPGAGC